LIGLQYLAQNGAFSAACLASSEARAVSSSGLDGWVEVLSSFLCKRYSRAWPLSPECSHLGAGFAFLVAAKRSGVLAAQPPSRRP
jgi:hypothetical protein